MAKSPPRCGRPATSSPPASAGLTSALGAGRVTSHVTGWQGWKRRVAGGILCVALSGCGTHHLRLSDSSPCTEWNSATQPEKSAYAETRSFPSSELKGKSKVAYIDAACDLPTAQDLGGIL